MADFGFNAGTGGAITVGPRGMATGTI